MKLFVASNHGADIQYLEVQASFAPGFSGVEVFGGSGPKTLESWRRSKAILDGSSFALKAKKVLINLVEGAGDLRQGQDKHTSLDGAFVMHIMHLGGHLSRVHESKQFLLLFDFDLKGAVQEAPWSVSKAFHALCRTSYEVVVGEQTHAQLTELLGKDDSRKNRIRSFRNLEHYLVWLKEAKTPGFAEPRLNVEPQIKTQENPSQPPPNFDDMQMSEELAEAAMVAAVGGHHLLLRGPPGLGKTMFARRFPSILPSLAKDKALSRLAIPGCVHYASDLLKPAFRSPHHSASVSAMTGNISNPGEMSLAHHGVLLMDEVPEFRRDIIESLREPLEHGLVQVSRANGQVAWPARFQWIGTANNCPCGWLFAKRKRCTCSSRRIQGYLAKLSGPLLDRICMHLVFEDSPEGYSSKLSSLSSTDMKQRVLAAKAANKKLGSEHWKKELCKWAPGLEQEFLSKRSLARFLMLAKSVALLRGSSYLSEVDVTKARRWTLQSAQKRLGLEDAL